MGTVWFDIAHAFVSCRDWWIFVTCSNSRCYSTWPFVISLRQIITLNFTQFPQFISKLTSWTRFVQKWPDRSSSIWNLIMSGSYPPPILPKPLSGLPFIAPKPNMPGQGMNGSHSDSNNLEEKRENGASPSSRSNAELFDLEAEMARRTSQRKRPKVCFTVCLHYLNLSFMIYYATFFNLLSTIRFCVQPQLFS